MKTNSIRFKVIINWHGEVHTFYTQCKSEERALYNAITRLAGKVGMKRMFVAPYVMDANQRRWEVMK
jgi:hypothetical protein